MTMTFDPTREDIPEGWQLGADSWRFHRQFFVRVGRAAAHAEYAAIIAQIRFHIAPRLDRYHYRVTLADGTPLIVSGSWHKLNGVERPDWTPKPVKAAAPPPAAPPAVPPPAKPLRASTLTLGNPAAAKALAERLRRFGIPPPTFSQAPPP